MMKVVEIDILYTKQPQTLFAGFLRILASTIQLREFSFDEAKFRGEENVGSFSGALEPSSYCLFIVVIETISFGN